MQAIHVRAGALFIDEFSQLQATLGHANNLFWTIARLPRYNLKLEDYAKPRETAGRVSKLTLSGDHLQVPPVPKSTSLLAPLEGTTDEHKVGAAMFANIGHVFVLETMMRFRDPILRAVLEKMRMPGGVGLEEEEWQAFMETNVDVESLDAQGKASFLKRTENHSSYLWCIDVGCLHVCEALCQTVTPYLVLPTGR
mgnify:CR=1 FL=1